MKTIVLVSICAAVTLALPSPTVAEEGVPADRCTESVCTPADNCRCASSNSPLPSEEQIPQLISLTFDEALTYDLYTEYWEPLLFNRKNPDGRQIGATFFVPHQYTDYQKVNTLYNEGFEIAVHSVTNNAFQDYWRGASEELLEQEYGGQKEILHKFANIPLEDIIGVRTPQLQMAGNLSVEAYIRSGLVYDSSWPTLTNHPLFPYTLDYLSIQECNLGVRCPNEAFPGFWILPIVDIYGVDTECNNLASCRVSGSADEIANWLVSEIDKVRRSSRVPLTLTVTSSWFNFVGYAWEGLRRALNKLADYDDVFLVSQKQVYNWARNPVPLSSFRTEDTSGRNAACNPVRCGLQMVGDVALRYMNSCVYCPQAYPWLGNPDGNLL